MADVHVPPNDLLLRIDLSEHPKHCFKVVMIQKVSEKNERKSGRSKVRERKGKERKEEERIE